MQKISYRISGAIPAKMISTMSLPLDALSDNLWWHVRTRTRQEILNSLPNRFNLHIEHRRKIRQL
jgi:hypothetical protein